jgi:Uma2 family endonuclease
LQQLLLLGWRGYLKNNLYFNGMEQANDNSKKRYTIEEDVEMQHPGDVKHERYDGGEITEVKEAAVSYNKQHYTIEEYLQMERASDVKHEYYKGEIFAMSGAGNRHNIIFSNVFIDIGIQLKKTSCRPYGSDMRMHIPENTLFTYPDISIYCGDPITIDKEEDTIIQPTIIIEILSKSTRNYDQGMKFKLYKDIPTLKEYMLIDTEKIDVNVFRVNTHNHWEQEQYTTLQETVLLPTVGISLSMQDIYLNTFLAKTVK